MRVLYRLAVYAALLGPVVLFAPTAQAAISNCVQGESFGSIEFGGENNIDNGCQNVDKIFSQFNVTGTSTTGDVVPPDVGNIGLAGLGTIDGSGSDALGIQLFDPTSPSDGADWQIRTNDQGQQNFLGTVDFVVTVSSASLLITNATFTVPALTSSQVTPNFSAGSGFTISAQFCANALTVDGCPAENFAEVGTPLLTDIFPGDVYTTPISATNQLAVRLILDVDFGTNNGQRGFDLTSVSFNFDQATPEPATFSLMGGALLGLALWRRRQKRRAATIT